MAIDVSHCSEQTAIDAMQVSNKPIFCTHIGARALQNDKRMGTDAMFQSCAEKGGVIGIEAPPKSTITQKNPDQNLESFMEHFEYIENLVGIDHVSFGPDTMYGDHVGFHHAVAKFFSIQKAEKEVPFVKGMENPSEASWNILRWLIKHGYSDAQIGKLVGGNALRVLREVWV
jgi:membrane dipeptidase